VTDLKAELHRRLKLLRASVISKVDGLSEYDMRRPMTPSGTNLLGLVKHLAGLEYGYLGESFQRMPPETMSWIEDGTIWQNADMWAAADESTEYLLGLYDRACSHADRTIDELDLDAPGWVEHWPPERQNTTLGDLLIRMVAETAQHAGHADIIRELIDGCAAVDDEMDEAEWQAYVLQIQTAANTFQQLPD
jgi:hypothetical protein